MAILDVGLVTKVLKRVLEESIKSSSAWSPRPDPTLSVLPPDKLDEGTLGLYLYHINEDPHFKNQPPVGSSTDPVPVQYNPMGLNLFYLLTTDAKADTEVEMLDAQLLLGLAVKSLHDHPVLTDKSEVNSIKIFEEIGIDKTDTRLHITMQPTAYNEAVSYWTAGQSPLRLSAYYQVSVVMLEPEEPPSRGGRVLDYGVHTFVTGAPRLISSKNILSVTIPDTGVTQDLELRPAEVPFDSRFTLLGNNLGGDDMQLVLNNSRWDEPIAADLSWGVTATDERVIAIVQNQTDGNDILPGLYSGKVLINEYRTMPDGSTRTFTKTSNETPFAITPRIDTISTPDGAGNVDVTGYIFQHSDISAEDVQVYLGTELLSSGTGGALNPGEYDISSPTTLEFRLPTSTASGHIPFRLLINGAESPPAWVEVT